MVEYDWLPFLKQCNQQTLARLTTRDYSDETLALMGIAHAHLTSDWMGFSGASEATIAALEARLGATLPPSYRAFLSVSDGFCQPAMLVPRIFSSHEVDWFRNTNPAEGSEEAIAQGRALFGTIEIPDEEYFIYGKDQDPITMRDAYIPATLRISAREIYGSALYLLNPKVITEDGEWEAWKIAHWLPGANRYRSFWDLMQDEYTFYARH